ncbi:Aste57867_6868 [Aphanomyces stellatus]|nr:hypothetical protein As57867_006847 [Aphanomyces stellatus]VFT83825.1 Aste57867_6868 [Aphanomyces stellatus]
MARHLDFVAHICGHETYWRHPTIIDAALIRYRQFCQLVKAHPKKVLVPTIDIALVRFAHQRIAPELACFQVPAAKDGASAYAETFLLWAETFKSPYSSSAPSFDAFLAHHNAMKQPFRKMKWDKFHAVPSRDCRFVGVDESYAMPEATAVAMAVASVGPDTVAAPTAVACLAVIGTPFKCDR